MKKPTQKEILDHLQLVIKREGSRLPSLYQSLHFVGDDPVKSNIEDLLEEILPTETLMLVRAVFAVNAVDPFDMEFIGKFYDDDEDLDAEN